MLRERLYKNKKEMTPEQIQRNARLNETISEILNHLTKKTEDLAESILVLETCKSFLMHQALHEGKAIAVEEREV